jgi:hypothetical protein
VTSACPVVWEIAKKKAKPKKSEAKSVPGNSTTDSEKLGAGGLVFCRKELVLFFSGIKRLWMDILRSSKFPARHEGVIS